MDFKSIKSRELEFSIHKKDFWHNHLKVSDFYQNREPAGPVNNELYAKTRLSTPILTSEEQENEARGQFMNQDLGNISLYYLPYKCDNAWRIELVSLSGRCDIWADETE